MNFLENFVSKLDQQNKVIGQFECNSNQVTTVFTGMLTSMGMSNPSGLKGSSSKAIKITKKGNKYTLILSMFNPPIKVTWTTAIPMNKLHSIIDKLIEDNKKVGYINIFNTKGLQSFQLALAN